jgi:hypothetical protein
MLCRPRLVDFAGGRQALGASTMLGLERSLATVDPLGLDADIIPARSRRWTTGSGCGLDGISSRIRDWLRDGSG